MFGGSVARRVAVRRMTARVVGSTAIVLGLAAAGASVVFAATGGALADLTISQRTAQGGTPVKGTVTLSVAVADDTVVLLSSTDTNVLTVPASVTVPAGATTATFTITTRFFAGPAAFACVHATAVGAATGCIRVAPAPPNPPGTLSPR
jgi:NAD dependent epimerase/dehydratase family enzyme